MSVANVDLLLFTRARIGPSISSSPPFIFDWSIAIWMTARNGI